MRCMVHGCEMSTTGCPLCPANFTIVPVGVGLQYVDTKVYDQLLADNNALVKMLQAVLGHYVTITRWPCHECNRPGPDAPLRLNKVTTEDGIIYWLGCSACNADALMDSINKLLMEVGSGDLLGFNLTAPEVPSEGRD